MSMKDGVKAMIHGALDTKDELMQTLLDAGLDVQTAMKASTVLTKKSVDECLERHLGERNAAEITATITKGGDLLN